MEINIKQAKALADITTTDRSRPATTHAYFSSKGEGYINGPAMIATDGHALAAIPVIVQEGEDVPAGAMIPVEALRHIAPLSRHADMAPIILNGAVRINTKLGFVDMPYPEDGPYPDVSMVRPKGEPVFTITLNAALLADLARALGQGNNGVRLEFFKPDTAVRVTTKNGVGLIMPMRDVGDYGV